MTDFIPYGRQCVTETDVAAVAATLQSDYLTTGPAVTAFEAACNAAFGSTHAVALTNATAALHVVYLALGLGEGDTLWTVPNTFLATANAARLCNAEVDFVDISASTFNMCASALEEKLRTAKKLPKIVVPVHFAGQPCDMQKIWELAEKYGFYVVEDAAHAVGATYKGQPVGNCAHSHAAVFSFHPVKIITTAEGGIITTNDAALAEKCRKLRSHGMVKPPELTAEHGNWYYAMDTLGLNYRMTDMQAALGTSQMARLPENISRRREIAKTYYDALKTLPFGCQRGNPDGQSSWHLFVIQCADSAERRALYDFFHAHKVGVQVHYIPVHTQPYYQALGFKTGDFPVAEHYYSRCLSLPMYHSLTAEQQNRVVGLLEAFVAERYNQQKTA